MSSWKFKSLQKAQDVIIIYFTETDDPPWANTRSVTIPVGDAEKLLKKLQATLHPGGKPGDS
jgi:hypothetical protein